MSWCSSKAVSKELIVYASWRKDIVMFPILALFKLQIGLGCLCFVFWRGTYSSLAFRRASSPLYYRQRWWVGVFHFFSLLVCIHLQQKFAPWEEATYHPNNHIYPREDILDDDISPATLVPGTLPRQFLAFVAAVSLIAPSSSSSSSNFFAFQRSQFK